MNQLEKKLNALYRPRPAPWKRPVLRAVSIAILALGAVTARLLLLGHLPAGVWWLVGLFGVLAGAGLIASFFGSDFWVALILGSP